MLNSISLNILSSLLLQLYNSNRNYKRPISTSWIIIC